MVCNEVLSYDGQIDKKAKSVQIQNHKIGQNAVKSRQKAVQISKVNS